MKILINKYKIETDSLETDLFDEGRHEVEDDLRHQVQSKFWMLNLKN